MTASSEATTNIRQRRLATGVICLSLVAFAALAPFATTPLGRSDAFIPAYETALITCNLVTAALLFGQFGYRRSRALLILAAGYLFTAGIAFAHALALPGLFSHAGLFGAGPSTVAWLYMIAHGGFPITRGSDRADDLGAAAAVLRRKLAQHIHICLHVSQGRRFLRRVSGKRRCRTRL